MNWDQLYKTQKELDTYIIKKQAIPTEQKVFLDKILALFVELGELANETRCFKFWSKKERNEREVILEEFVDGVHFILSLGLDKGFRYSGEVVQQKLEEEAPETTLFTNVFNACTFFQASPTKENYNHLFHSYLRLANKLGFEEEDIEYAYQKKNEINYKRQDTGY